MLVYLQKATSAIKTLHQRYKNRNAMSRALDKYGCNVNCPHCNAWMHCNDKTVAQPMLNYPGIYNYTCGNCGGSSTWDFGMAPVPIMIDGGKVQLELNAP
jgi:transcription elongation factor Elf1